MKFNNMGEQIKKINPLIEVPYKDHFSTVAGGDGGGIWIVLMSIENKGIMEIL